MKYYQNHQILQKLEFAPKNQKKNLFHNVKVKYKKPKIKILVKMNNYLKHQIQMICYHQKAQMKMSQEMSKPI